MSAAAVVEMQSERGADVYVPVSAMSLALHDLVQPLTTLQFLLVIGAEAGDCESLREAFHAGIVECERMNECVAVMRAQMRTAAEEGARR